jgi:hypothetical protein
MSLADLNKLLELNFILALSQIKQSTLGSGVPALGFLYRRHSVFHALSGQQIRRMLATSNLVLSFETFAIQAHAGLLPHRFYQI